MKAVANDDFLNIFNKKGNILRISLGLMFKKNLYYLPLLNNRDFQNLENLYVIEGKNNSFSLHTDKNNLVFEKPFVIMKQISKELKDKTLYSWKRGDQISRNNLPKKGDIIATFSGPFYTESNFISCVLMVQKSFILVFEQSTSTKNYASLRLLKKDSVNYNENYENYHFINVTE